ncbi:acyl-CoA dehydrogenase family protein [Candidatus Poriferisocius sp.]|uniref:acyl-CoA dehydrogenase family protein n=1 Tax=Candidatus Poriferisocius sp. TaxID=3101276 RepID=UPI003B01D13D
MSEFIDADEAALLATSFAAAMVDAPGPGEADQALNDLGWADLLDAAPAHGAAIAFGALGATGSAATLLDDVVAHALGFPISPSVCVLFSAHLHTNPAAPQPGDPRSLMDENPLVVDGLVSSRIDQATTVLFAVDEFPGTEVASVDAGWLRESVTTGIDPAHAYRHVSARVPTEAVTPVVAEGNWEPAVTAARMALAHQLIGGARWMLAEARQHAIDRVQFGRPVASFQAIRHKLAESLVLIEGAESLAVACLRDPDPMLVALAKSLAGKAALTTAAHAQQVLAGIGFTNERRFHLWLKRMMVVDTLYGSSKWLTTEIGRDLLIFGTVPRLIEI